MRSNSCSCEIVSLELDSVWLYMRLRKHQFRISLLSRSKSLQPIHSYISRITNETISSNFCSAQLKPTKFGHRHSAIVELNTLSRLLRPILVGRARSAPEVSFIRVSLLNFPTLSTDSHRPRRISAWARRSKRFRGCYLLASSLAFGAPMWLAVISSRLRMMDETLIELNFR